jgi:hypothetical protein
VRAQDWLNQDDVEKDTNLEILEDKAVGVEVYRSNDDGPNTGFGNEVDAPVPFKTINVRIDPARGGPWPFVALTDDVDTKVGDVWRVTQADGRTRRLLVKQTNFRHATVDVGLDYE